jgi:hypothetical protein
MIRRAQLQTFLTCIAAELAGNIREEVQSDYARKTIDSLNLVLSRLIAEAGRGQALALASRDAWLRLEPHFPTASVGELPPRMASEPITPLESLDAIGVRLQRGLLERNGFDRFVDALREGDVAAREWLRESASALNELLQGLQDNLVAPRSRQGAATVADDPEDLRRRLGRYLRGRFPSLPEGCVTQLAIATGGQIKRTALFRL